MSANEFWPYKNGALNLGKEGGGGGVVLFSLCVFVSDTWPIATNKIGPNLQGLLCGCSEYFNQT